MVYPDKEILFNYKSNEVQRPVTTWLNLKNTTVNERSQTQNTT